MKKMAEPTFMAGKGASRKREDELRKRYKTIMNKASVEAAYSSHFQIFCLKDTPDFTIICFLIEECHKDLEVPQNAA